MNVNRLAKTLEGSSKALTGFSVLKVSGEDRERFISGQTTNDVQGLEVGHFNLNSRLDRGGKLKAFFYLLKEKECLYLLVPRELSAFLKEDLEKFIIMDEVEIEQSSLHCHLIFSAFEDPSLHYKLGDNAFHGEFGFLPASLFLTIEEEWQGRGELEDDYFKSLCLLRGVPLLDSTATIDQLVTDTVVNLAGVSLKKGCFLGQETVAKIETRRGGAYLPVVLKPEMPLKLECGEKFKVNEKVAGRFLDFAQVDSEYLVVASLLRNFRVDKKELNFLTDSESFEAVVHYLPFGGGFEKEDYVEFLFADAVETFQSVGNEEAVSLFKNILKVKPTHEDSLESIGVIYGRMERFEEGIGFMDRVLESNPDSVMAHTNKSLFFMRLGKIEEAEEEKAQATVKSFASFGKEANQKKEEERLAQEKEAEIARRFGMFQQVLEMDPEDELANYGMADVLYERGKANESIPLLQTVLSNNEGYSVAYLLLGKSYLKVGQVEQAKETLKKGIEVASSKGDLMPANEMQGLLSGL